MEQGAFLFLSINNQRRNIKTRFNNFIKKFIKIVCYYLSYVFITHINHPSVKLIILHHFLDFNTKIYFFSTFLLKIY